MAELVYALCALTSLACTLLLARGFLRSRARLLLWSALCFAGFFVDNGVLFLDVVVFPETDLSGLRGFARMVGVVGIGCLLYGMIMDSE